MPVCFGWTVHSRSHGAEERPKRPQTYADNTNIFDDKKVNTPPLYAIVWTTLDRTAPISADSVSIVESRLNSVVEKEVRLQ